MTGASQNGHPPEGPGSLFDRFPWLYAFCRDHLFRDDTTLIAATLWTGTEVGTENGNGTVPSNRTAGGTPAGGARGVPPAKARLLELGCGPGFYARRLGETFGHLDVTGIDRSESQLRRARTLADLLDNCSFEKGDARALAAPDASFDAVVASRLFIILPERERALAEAYRVLKPGGRLFIAEPRSALRAAVPLRAMRLLAGLEALFLGRLDHYREPGAVSVMTAGEFGELVESQPWRVVRCWQDFWYQYAVCEKRGSRE